MFTLLLGSLTGEAASVLSAQQNLCLIFHWHHWNVALRAGGQFAPLSGLSLVLLNS